MCKTAIAPLQEHSKERASGACKRAIEVTCGNELTPNRTNTLYNANTMYNVQ